MHRKLCLLLTAAFPVAFAPACDGDDDIASAGNETRDASSPAPDSAVGRDAATDARTQDAASDAARGELSLAFRAVDAVGNEVRCGETGLAVAGLTDVSLGDLRVYVHDVRLLKGDREVPFDLVQDGAWQVGDVALLDFEDQTSECQLAVFGKATSAETNRVLRGTPREAGPYTGVAFTLGVPFDKNYLELATAPSPLNISGMDHGTDGRQFMRFVFYSPSSIAALDGGVADGGSADAGQSLQGKHNLLMLRSVCDSVTSGDAGTEPASPEVCAKSNRGEVRLQGDPTTKAVLLDVNALVTGYPTPGRANASSPKLSNEGRIDCFGPLHAGDLGPGGAFGIGAQRCGTFYPNLGLDFTTGAATATQTTFRIED